MTQATHWFALILLCASSIASRPATAQVDNSEARKERIKENLFFLFPQIDGLPVVIQDLTATGVDGMERGLFVIDGQQRQAFLTNEGDTEFYLVAAGPFDVSKTADELSVARTERAVEERERAAEVFESLKPHIEGMPAKGPADAPVTIVEFSDFQCPYCATASSTIDEVLAQNPEDVRIVFMQFPLESIHPWARSAAIASVCTANQSVDAFWDLHDDYFSSQDELDSQNVMTKSRDFLSDTGIDLDTWTTCATDEASDAYNAASALIDEHLELGVNYGVNSTPGFFINGRYVSGAQPADTFQQLIELAREQ